MKNLDLFSRRLLIVATAISMVFISSAIFLFSLNYVGSVQAKETNVYDYNVKPLKYIISPADTIEDMDKLTDIDIFAVHAFGMGIRDGNLYFGILYNNNTIGLHVAPAEGEDVIPW
ncbi:hypothetical protein ACFLU5_17985 [Bacteroidota bacterium]